ASELVHFPNHFLFRERGLSSLTDLLYRQVAVYASENFWKRNALIRVVRLATSPANQSAGGLAHSKSFATFEAWSNRAPASWTAAALCRFVLIPPRFSSVLSVASC